MFSQYLFINMDFEFLGFFTKSSVLGLAFEGANKIMCFECISVNLEWYIDLIMFIIENICS